MDHVRCNMIIGQVSGPLGGYQSRTSRGFLEFGKSAKMSMSGVYTAYHSMQYIPVL